MSVPSKATWEEATRTKKGEKPFAMLVEEAIDVVKSRKGASDTDRRRQKVAHAAEEMLRSG